MVAPKRMISMNFVGLKPQKRANIGGKKLTWNLLDKWNAICPFILLVFATKALKLTMSQNYSQLEVLKQPDPRCDSCGYVLPSQTALTGLRCGLDYFNSSYIMRKFQLMQYFPEVHDYNACESWTQELEPDQLKCGFSFSATKSGGFAA